MAEAKHIWIEVPPGQGSRHDAICKACGMRRSVANADKLPCRGQASFAPRDHKADYDPMDDI